MKIRNSILALLFCFVNTLQAQFSVASIFSDNMVLQRNVKIPVWGSAKANDEIIVTFHNQTKITKADKNGKWSIHLEDEMEGGPYELTIKNESTIQIKNILVGEVWICSGQSNMEWTVGQSDNAKSEIENATFSNIRQIKIPKEINSVPNPDFKKATWKVCSPETVADFTGIGYYYAKQLQEKLHVPIGLINATWGGKNIETWISREGFESNDEFKEMMVQMPKIDLNSILENKLIKEQNRIEKIENSKFSNQNNLLFKDLLFDDTNWPELTQPGIWEEQSLGNFDGIVWLRKHITISKKELEEKGTLEIPAIDDNDITYINGIKIGETNGWDTKRTYEIPIGILKEGDNSIAIRVVDNGGGGGIYGEPNALKLVFGKNQKVLSGLWKFQVESIKKGINENEFPSLCFNAMINPLIPFAFKGVIWYQGESNVPRAYQYNKAFPLLINDWRSKWESEFPFYFVQLASFTNKGNSNEGCPWAELREAQTNALTTPNTGMVITTDIGTPASIHPTNKQEVGKRLASIALNNLYNQKMICKGPTFKSFENRETKAIVTFENIGSGLTSLNNSNIIYGFEVAGAEQVFYSAIGLLKENKIILSCEDVIKPLFVRFGWIADASRCNLFNLEGFPAEPFRSDNFQLKTTFEKYEIIPLK